jgi:serine/threonine-protein kinase
MGFWKRLFGKDEPEAAPPPSEAQPDESPAGEERAGAEQTTDERATEEQTTEEQTTEEQQREEAAEREARTLARLRRIGREGGADVDEAIALLRHHTGSAKQTRVLNALLEGLHDDPALDPIRVACATLLDERGDREQAKQLLAPTRSVAGMMLAAELFATTGNLPRAVSMIERVLARNIDTPGAQERHQRWSAQIGRDLERDRVDDSATVVAPNEESTTFRLVRQIARGGAGTIYEAEDELLGRRLAFKVYHRAERDREQIEREAQTAVRLAGPGILRIFDADPTKGWLATEWIARGSLREVLKAGRVHDLFPLDAWLPQLVDALGRIHDSGLVHADIKPSNVLFRQLDDPVIGDFGVCVPAGTKATGGTPGYMSPERLDGGRADPQDDVYALGRIIEDVLGARDDAEKNATEETRTEEEARRYAKVALACMAESAERPTDAMAVSQLLKEP